MMVLGEFITDLKEALGPDADIAGEKYMKGTFTDSACKDEKLIYEA